MYGYEEYFLDMTPGKSYWCDECEKIVSENCGHENFGSKYYLRDISPGKTYWCNDCDA